MKKKPEIIEAEIKLTVSQIVEIRKYLPYGFSSHIARTRKGITLRQVKSVLAQTTKNPKLNDIVWKAVCKKLTAADRLDLVKLVEERNFFCKNWLDI